MFLCVTSRNLFSRGDRSLAKHGGSIDWFLYGTHDSLEGVLTYLSESFINNLCVKICNSFNTL